MYDQHEVEVADEITNQDESGTEELLTDADLGLSEEVDAPITDDDLSQYGAEVEENPWAWTEGLDPEKVKKTYNKFTPEWEAAKRDREEAERMRAELEAERQRFAEEIRFGRLVEEDERFRNHVLAFDPSAAQEGEDAGALALRRVQEMEAAIAAERELADVHKWAADNGMPEFSDQELIAHAIQSGIPSLMTAYRDKFFDAAAEAKKQKALADIKKSRGAAVVTKTAGESKAQKVYSEDAIAAMSDADFQKNLPDILSFFKGRK